MSAFCKKEIYVQATYVSLDTTKLRVYSSNYLPLLFSSRKPLYVYRGNKKLKFNESVIKNVVCDDYVRVNITAQ